MTSRASEPSMTTNHSELTVKEGHERLPPAEPGKAGSQFPELFPDPCLLATPAVIQIHSHSECIPSTLPGLGDGPHYELVPCFPPSPACRLPQIVTVLCASLASSVPAGKQ